MTHLSGRYRTSLVIGLAGIAMLAALGCNDTAKPASSMAGAEAGKGRTQLWSENCTRCHENRSPSSYSDREWEVAMMHMKLRANLTATEYREITEFLKSANQ